MSSSTPTTSARDGQGIRTKNERSTDALKTFSRETVAKIWIPPTPRPSRLGACGQLQLEKERDLVQIQRALELERSAHTEKLRLFREPTQHVEYPKNLRISMASNLYTSNISVMFMIEGHEGHDDTLDKSLSRYNQQYDRLMEHQAKL